MTLHDVAEPPQIFDRFFLVSRRLSSPPRRLAQGTELLFFGAHE